LKYVYAQIVDDTKGATLASASTLEKSLRGDSKQGGNIEASKLVGKAIAAFAEIRSRGAILRLQSSLEKPLQSAPERRESRPWFLTVGVICITAELRQSQRRPGNLD
jgi:hypothetical protein